MADSRRERRHQARQDRKPSPPPSAPSRIEKPRSDRLRPLFLGLIAAAGGATIALAVSRPFPPSESPRLPPAAAAPADLTLGRLLELPPAERANLDLAEMNLLCARGLPGAENFDVQAGLRTLDQWADAVFRDTQRNFHRFRARPQDYENSEVFYKMGMLITVLQQDLGIRYNPALIDVPDAKADAAFLTAPPTTAASRSTTTPSKPRSAPPPSAKKTGSSSARPTLANAPPSFTRSSRAAVVAASIPSITSVMSSPVYPP